VKFFIFVTKFWSIEVGHNCAAIIVNHVANKWVWQPQDFARKN